VTHFELRVNHLDAPRLAADADCASPTDERSGGGGGGGSSKNGGGGSSENGGGGASENGGGGASENGGGGSSENGGGGASENGGSGGGGAASDGVELSRESPTEGAKRPKGAVESDWDVVESKGDGVKSGGDAGKDRPLPSQPMGNGKRGGFPAMIQELGVTPTSHHSVITGHRGYTLIEVFLPLTKRVEVRWRPISSSAGATPPEPAADGGGPRPDTNSGDGTPRASETAADAEMLKPTVVHTSLHSIGEGLLQTTHRITYVTRCCVDSCAPCFLSCGSLALVGYSAHTSRQRCAPTCIPPRYFSHDRTDFKGGLKTLDTVRFRYTVDAELSTLTTVDVLIKGGARVASVTGHGLQSWQASALCIFQPVGCLVVWSTLWHRQNTHWVHTHKQTCLITNVTAWQVQPQGDFQQASISEAKNGRDFSIPPFRSIPRRATTDCRLPFVFFRRSYASR
jgi:hypothetical protein